MSWFRSHLPDDVVKRRPLNDDRLGRALDAFFAHYPGEPDRVVVLRAR